MLEKKKLSKKSMQAFNKIYLGQNNGIGPVSSNNQAIQESKSMNRIPQKQQSKDV